MGEETPWIYFMPWSSDIRESISIGPVTFWPYSSEASQRINDNQVREYLDEYFSHFVDHRGEPRNWITVCSHGNGAFMLLDNVVHKEIRSAVDILTFSEIAPRVKNSVCADNTSMGPPSADTFELYSKPIELDCPAAVICTRQRSDLFDLRELKFAQPYTVGPYTWNMDKRLMKALEGIFALKEQTPILRSLEWFRMAHGALGPSWQSSPLTILVMMSTAFEILLQLPKNGKRKCFVGCIEASIAHDGFKRDVRNIEGESVDLSLAGWWAWDFYKFRSRIVHGDVVQDKELYIQDWVSHLEVADLVFYELILCRLFELGCIGDEVLSVGDKVVPGNKEKMPLEPMLRSLYGLNDIHKALGWIG